jgi:GrpB-like predicted nucleotidyltransferase (UPF0157 family)
MRLVRENEIRVRISARFDSEKAELAALLPGARIEHVGSTAVPDSLTKGDLDICVIVPATDFEDAAETLGNSYEVHQLENWTEDFASYNTRPRGHDSVGIQLITEGSAEEDWFIGWRERLRSDLELRLRYDKTKLDHADGTTDAYRAAKERLIRAER